MKTRDWPLTIVKASKKHITKALVIFLFIVEVYAGIKIYGNLQQISIFYDTLFVYGETFFSTILNLLGSVKRPASKK